MELSCLMSRSMRSKPWGTQVARILKSALEAVDPRVAVLNSINLSGDILEVDGLKYDLTRIKHVFLVGAGKAGQPMTNAVQEILRTRLKGGHMIIKEGYGQDNDHTDQVEIIEAGHPIPDIRGVTGTNKIIHLLENTAQDDLVICLISGGGSALLVSPVPGVTLEDLQILTEILLASGATINEINTLRKHLDQAKGGHIARLAAPASLVSFILSDVIGDPLDVIASGPTVPDPTTFADAITILDRYRITDQVPSSILNHLKQGTSGAIEETPKPGDHFFDRAQNFIVGSNRIATLAALKQAKEEGFHTMVLSNFLQGEASQVGKALAAILRQVAAYGHPLPRPACLIIGGETTVTLHGTGHGGRNQELALGSVRDLAGLENIALITLATDGGDGQTDAAGALVTGDTYHNAQARDLNPHIHLANNDAYNFFKPMDDLLITGPTQTNVNDLTFLFAF
jgi:glycerate 2-kinase